MAAGSGETTLFVEEPPPEELAATAATVAVQTINNERKHMFLTRPCKIVWLALPLFLAAACSTTPRADNAAENQNAFSSLPPGSGAQVGAYPTSSSPTGQLAYSAPQGASPADWKVAEELRATLMANRKLARTPFTATVSNGTVTLKGHARTEGEKKRIEEMVAQLPGVQRVDNELQIGNRLAVGGSNQTE